MQRTLSNKCFFFILLYGWIKTINWKYLTQANTYFTFASIVMVLFLKATSKLSILIGLPFRQWAFWLRIQSHVTQSPDGTPARSCLRMRRATITMAMQLHKWINSIIIKNNLLYKLIKYTNFGVCRKCKGDW